MRSFSSAVTLIALFFLGLCTLADAAPRVKPPLEAVRRDDVSSVIGHLASVDAAKGNLIFRLPASLLARLR